MAVRSIAMRAYEQALANQKVNGGLRRAESLGKDQAQGFAETIKDSMRKVNDMEEEKHAMINSFASGETQNVHELMISLQKAGLAMKMTSAVRNKVMDAYKELSKIAL